MSRPDLGERPKQGLDVAGIKCLFKFRVRLRNLSNCYIIIPGKRREISPPLDAVVFDLFNSLALSEYNGRKQLFYQGDWEMVLRRYGIKRVCPFGHSRRL